ncbi:hypothetical protein BJX70DRAFT_397292 [Aspergillus crustosus]
MDYETVNAQEWQLVGYGGRKVANQSTSVPETHTQLSSGPATPHPSSRNNVPACGTTGGRGRGRGRGQAHTGSSHASHLLRDSPAKSKWRDGLEPDGLVRLPAAFGTIKYDFINAAKTMGLGTKTTAALGLDEVIKDISTKTGAHIQRPLWPDKTIKVWGNSDQVKVAQELVMTIGAKCHTSNNKPKTRQDWSKVHAYSINKEAKAETLEQGETIVNLLRQAPESSIVSPEQLLFLWPTDGPSMVECLGPQSEALDMIRARFRCHVFIPKDMPGYICALGHDHDDMKEIARRIRVLWAEAVAKTNVKTKIYLVEPPTPKKMKTKIMVIKQNQLHTPCLKGSHLKGHELKIWLERYGMIQANNNSRLVGVVDDCLKSIASVRGHLRLRVNLGTFVLESYQVPENDKSFYGYDEFREMLLHEQSKGRLIPGLKVSQAELLDRCFKANHLFEPCDSTTTSVDTAKLAYSVNFEFLGSDRSMLRMEAEFAKRTGALEYEITERRWLRPRVEGQFGDKRPPLHLAIIDFERSDWQLELKSLEFHQASTIDAALREFSHKIGFKCPAGQDKISAKPTRKVIFPPEPPVSRVVEKSAIRFRFKGTKYIFEIARYDEYRRNNMPIGTGTIVGAMSDIPYTSWGASIFSTDWDNLLGVHANLPVGQSACYSPKLVTFFPSGEPSPVPHNQASGFWEFIGLVKQAAELLGPSGSIPDASDSETASNSGRTSLQMAAVVPSSNPAPSPTAMIHTDLGTLF